MLRAFAPRAFTLVEVMLTLCLLALVAGLCWPPMARLIEAQRLGKAADQVRSRWYQARVQAVETGGTVAFQYALGGGDYCVRHLSTEALEEYDDDASGGEAGPGEITGTLPEGVAFAAGEVDENTPAYSAASFETGATGEANWSEPILFYGDATATSAKVTLVDRRGRAVEVALRGLTGVATVGEVFQLRESTP